MEVEPLKNMKFHVKSNRNLILQPYRSATSEIPGNTLLIVLRKTKWLGKVLQPHGNQVTH